MRIRSMCSLYPTTRIQNAEYKIQNTEYRIQNHRIQDIINGGANELRLVLLPLLGTKKSYLESPIMIS